MSNVKLNDIHRWARNALERMMAAKVAPTPENYALWFARSRGDDGELIKAIEDIERRGAKEGETAALYARFFGVEREGVAIREGIERMQETTARLLSILETSQSNNLNYSRTLDSYTEQLETPQTLSGLKDLIASLVGETAAMAAHQKRLENALETAANDVVELRRTLDDTRREASTDALTGLANRKVFEQELTSAREAAHSSGNPLSLVMIDIDHFKRLNDTYGHPVGDQVLRLVAAIMMENLKGRDLAARYGGEEFALILPDTSLAGAAVVAEQIRRTVAAKTIVNRSSGEVLGVVTLSAGVAQYSGQEALAELISRADQALYQAKRQGRNRIVTLSLPNLVQGKNPDTALPQV
jgi:diguanylate cyclase